jgi:hypothetical protein
MAGPLSVKVNLNNLNKTIREIEGITEYEVKIALQRIATIGEVEMRRTIRTSSTAFSKFRLGLGLGSRGRIRTGKMYDSVSSRVNSGSKQVTAQVGWIRNPLEYFRYQEYGFINKWRFAGIGKRSSGPNAPKFWRFKPAAPKKTEGMFALRNARQQMLDKIPSVFDQTKKNVSRRLGRRK